MSDAKTIDVSRVVFASTTFPTPEDKALWESLTPAERLAVIQRDEDAGFKSGVAGNASLQEIFAEFGRS
jgi:hypothetical protein